MAGGLVWRELRADLPPLVRLVAVQLPPAARVLVPQKPPIQLLPHPPVHAVALRQRVALELQRAPGAEPLRLRLRRARLRLPLLPRLLFEALGLRRRLLRRLRRAAERQQRSNANKGTEADTWVRRQMQSNSRGQRASIEAK